MEAVKGATFSIQPGEIFGLLGPNGAGKTSLLRMLGTIIAPTSGYCWVAGLRTDQNPDAVRQHIGFLSGNTKLYGRLTAREELRYFGYLHGLSKQRIRRRTDELCEILDMTDFLDRRCDTLSTGQSQKVSIARVLLHDPEVLILDEPTTGLDIMTCQTILSFIRDSKHSGRSIIFSTHYMTEAEILCDRLALIHRGVILAIGPKERLYKQTGSNNLTDAFVRLVNEANLVSP
ncbi:MAG: ATP-binding cassette domain-containing protein [Candidatus Hydrogenedentota bacterium]